MMETFSLAWWQIVVAGIATLAIFSFLIRENPIYRKFEHIFIGVATAVGIGTVIRYFILPEMIDPLFGLDRIIFPDGTAAEPYNKGNLLLLIPMLFGSLYYFILSKKLSWIAQLVIGFSLGVSGGLAFRGFLNEFIPQFIDSFRPLYIPSETFKSLSNVAFVLILICSMSYFFFTFKRSETGVVAKSANVGRYLMMCCFGAFFGSTVMAREALLVERIDFLLSNFFPAIGRLFS